MFIYAQSTNEYEGTHVAFTLFTGAVILIFFTLLKLLNDSKALLNTPQQILLLLRKPSIRLTKTVSIIIQMREEVNKLEVKASAVSCLVT